MKTLYCEDCHEAFTGCDETQTYNCIHCGTELVDAFQCKECDGDFGEDELHEGYCDECLEKHASYETALDYSEAGERTFVELDQFLGYIFSTSEIEEILHKTLADARKLFDHQVRRESKNYCLTDKDDFALYVDRNKKGLE